MTRTIATMVSLLPLLAGLALGSAACARETEAPADAEIAARVHGRVQDALDDLDATVEQRRQIEPLEQRLVDEIVGLREGAQGAHEQAAELWLSDNPDPKRAHALVDERLDAARQAAHQMTDLVLDLHRVLTPEQRQALVERLKERHERLSHRF
jgi:Spy/CpxP family protein refolding chaperone